MAGTSGGVDDSRRYKKEGDRMFKRKIALSMIPAALAVIMAGCGGSSDDAASTESTDITVERGPVLGALVLDRNGKRATEIGNGLYRFAEGISYPVTVDGGYIDVNRNDSIDAGDVRFTFGMEIADGSAATLVNTIARNAEIKAMLKNRFGLSEAEIEDEIPGSSREIAAVSDVLYAYCLENKVEPARLTLTDVEEVGERIEERLRLYSEDNRSVSELEAELIAGLGVQTLSDDEIAEAAEDLNRTRTQERDTDEDADSSLPDDNSSEEQVQSTQEEHAGTTLQLQENNTTWERDGSQTDELSAAELSEEQKAGLLFMIEEEKMARDVYEYFYAKWELKIFDNISLSEQQHMDAVKTLLDKYQLTPPATLEERGRFENDQLQAMYDTLIASGESSIVEALEVGKLIEETDIEDLQKLVEAVPEEIAKVYESLLNGSYNHLSAFENQLSNY
jgi:hypothetical protein